MSKLIVGVSDFLNQNVLEINVNDYKGDIGYRSAISIALIVNKISGGMIHISGKVNGAIYLECSRCLETYPYFINILVDSDVNIIDRQFDVDEEIRQLLLLELPMKPLCDEKCFGICEPCGKQNKKDDSCLCERGNDKCMNNRWEALLNKHDWGK